MKINAIKLSSKHKFIIKPMCFVKVNLSIEYFLKNIKFI